MGTVILMQMFLLLLGASARTKSKTCSRRIKHYIGAASIAIALIFIICFCLILFPDVMTNIKADSVSNGISVFLIVGPSTVALYQVAVAFTVVENDLRVFDQLRSSRTLNYAHFSAFLIVRSFLICSLT
eukprot:UN02756